MKSILVVEDNEDSREFLSLMLRGAGYDVLEAEHGRDALDQLETAKALPCLLILDIMMPVMSGPELLEAMGENSRLADIPVIVVSAGGRPRQISDDTKFMGKPAEPRLVLAAVREICGGP